MTNYVKQFNELVDPIKVMLELSDSKYVIKTKHTVNDRIYQIRIVKRNTTNVFCYPIHKSISQPELSLYYDYNDEVIYIKSTVVDKHNDGPRFYQYNFRDKTKLTEMYDRKNVTPKLIAYFPSIKYNRSGTIIRDARYKIEHNFKMSKNNFERTKKIIFIFLEQLNSAL